MAIANLGIGRHSRLKDLLRPGADFSRTTEQAIEREAAVFIACFSTASLALEKSDLNEEILLAVEQSRLRSPGATWIMPVRFDECQLPAFRLGGGRMLSGIVSADLFGERKDANAARLIDSVRRGLGMPALSNSVLDALYRADQALVADSIIALKQGAVQMLGPQAGELDLLGYEGAQALGDRWDVLQNYAEVAFPKDHSYSREIIDASYDPAWRQALRDWAEQNPGLLASPVPPGIAAFDYAAALDLDRYLGEFSEPSAELTTALSAERLPCSPSLVTHSPELASAVMRIWRLTSADSPMRQTAAALSAQGATAQLTADDDPDAADAIQPETEIRQSDRPATAADDDRHDKSLTDILGRLFRLPAADAERLRRESVSQRLGFVFRAEASLFSSACLVAYKELDSPPTLLTGADLREADLTDANLAPGGSAIAFTRDFIPGRYLCLTPEPGIGRIAVKPDGSLSFTFLTLPRSLRSPQGVFALAEDVLLITTQSDLLVVDIGSGAAEVAAHFRVSNEIRALAVIDQSLLGVVLEPERGLCEAVLLDIETGQVQWAIPVSAHGRAFGWSSDGLLISYDNALVYYGSTEVPSRIATDAQPSGYQISVCGRDAVMVSGDGLVTRFRLDRAADAYCVPVHNGAGTAVLATGSEILSAGSDGTIAVLRPDAAGALTVAGRLQRRLQCAGAKVDGLRRDRERLLFLANGAKDAGSVAKV